MLHKWNSSMKKFRMIRILFDIENWLWKSELCTFWRLLLKWPQDLRGWLLVLGIKKGLVECATVCVKSVVILTYLRPSVSPTGICGIGHIDSHVIQEIWGQSQTKYRVGQLKNMYVVKWKGNPSNLVMWRFWHDFLIRIR